MNTPKHDEQEYKNETTKDNKERRENKSYLEMPTKKDWNLIKIRSTAHLHNQITPLEVLLALVH